MGKREARANPHGANMSWDKPTLVGFTTFVYAQKVPLSSLPVDSPYLEWSYDQAIAEVLSLPSKLAPSVYTKAVYNYGMDALISLAQDLNDPVAVTIGPPPTGITATATADVNSTGNIVGFTLIDKGAGYVVPPPVTIAAPSLPGGITATATAILETDSVFSFLITNPGTGYPVSDFWAKLRKKYSILNFIPGPIVESHDVTTGSTWSVSENLKSLTIAALDQLKTPYGRAYLKYAEAYGPNVIGYS